jgi:hypothetical protein
MATTPQRSCVLFEGITLNGTSLSVGFQVLLGQHLKNFVEIDLELRTDMSCVPIFPVTHFFYALATVPYRCCIDFLVSTWDLDALTEGLTQRNRLDTKRVSNDSCWHWTWIQRTIVEDSTCLNAATLNLH